MPPAVAAHRDLLEAAMVFPAEKSPWPLPQMAAITAAYAEAAAWYSGQPEALIEHYGAAETQKRSRRGVRAAIRRFWGQVPPSPDSEPDARVHVPLGTTIPASSAALLYGEEPRIRPSSENVTPEQIRAFERTKGIFARASWAVRRLESAEVAAGLGDVYWAVAWSTSASGPLVRPHVVYPDRVIPTFAGGELASAVVWEEARSGHSVYRHLIDYTPGRIEHALYCGSTHNLGGLVPLTEHALTAGLVVDERGGMDTGYAGLAIEHVPNVTPNRRLAGDPTGRHLGRPDTAGCEDLMASLDLKATLLDSEFVVAQHRILIPSGLAESMGPGNGVVANPMQNVFVKVDSADDGSEGLVRSASMTAFDLRVEQYEAAMRADAIRIAQNSGYGPGFLGLDQGGAAQTATETHSRDRQTALTREAKTRILGPAEERLWLAVSTIDAHLNGGRDGSAAVEVSVEFPPSHAPSLSEIAQALQVLRTSESTSVRYRVERLNPEWDAKRVEAEVALIYAESGMAVTDLGLLPGDSPDPEDDRVGDPDDAPPEG